MCQITPQAKNIHCTFFGQFLQNIAYVHIPLVCTCRQTGTRSELGLWIPGVDLVTLSCTAPTPVWWVPHLELVPDLQVLHWATAEPRPCSWPSPSSQGWKYVFWVFPWLKHNQSSTWPHKMLLQTQWKVGWQQVAVGWQRVDRFFLAKPELNTPGLKAFMKLQTLLTINSMSCLPKVPTLYLSYLKTGTDETLGR